MCARRASATHGAGSARIGRWTADRDAATTVGNHRLLLSAATERQRSVRHRPVHVRSYTAALERATGATVRQPGDVRADRHADRDRASADTRLGNVTNLDYPFHFDRLGRTALTTDDDHV